MIKVLFLIENLAGGGAEKVLVNLVNNMDKTKYDVTLRTLFDYGVNKKHLNNNVKYEYVYKNRFKGSNYLTLLPSSYIYKNVAHGSFDLIVVYLHGVLTKIVANAPANQKTISYLHANMESSPFIASFKTKKQLVDCFETYDAIVSVSESVQQSFQKVTGLKDNLHVLYNTFDVEGIRLKADEPLNDIIENKEPNTINLCSVGKLEEVKGYLRLLKVVKRIKQDGLNFILRIVGEGSQRSQLEKYIKDHNLQNNVQLMGFQSNPYKFIAHSDLFVCSSYSEGFSSVVVESIILGVPVITTDCAGMGEILGKNNEYGMIVDNNEEGLYEGLKKLLLDKELFNHYQVKAVERSSFFSTEQSVKEVESLIDLVSKK